MKKILVKSDFSYSDYALGLVAYEIITEDQWQVIQKAMKDGLPIYLGEYAGKHSEVRFCLEENDVELVTDDQSKIQFFEEMFDSSFIGNYSLVDKIFEESE
ncbi:hypothetical protein EEL30_21425 [Brevibacillus laterosporus]|uniref:Uncharacterized protein n=1 Tax=Brevibacillus laterosporus TaxID=1465 RepID=A0A518VCA5_BRELA|nr:hypothetical protein EEL30_21425 [Brevibacillus laterosporus]